MKKGLLWACFVVASLLSFFPNIHDFYVGDDFCLLEQSRNLSGRLLLTPGFAAYFRPIPLICYHLLGKIVGLQPFGFHMTSLLIHLMNVFLLYLIISNLTRDKMVSALAGLGFSSHFAHVEAVVWISSLNEVLASSFGLLFLWSFWKSIGCKSRWGIPYSASLFLLVLALFSKESMVILPLLAVVLALLYVNEDRKKCLWLLGPHLLLILGYIFLRLSLGAAMPTLAPGKQGAFSLSPVSVLSNYGHFLINLFLPIRFIFDLSGYAAYEQLAFLNPARGPLLIALVATLLVILLLLILLGKSLRAGKALWAGGLWTLVALLPYVFFAGKGERFLYFASAGTSLIFASLLCALIGKRKIFGTALVVLFFILGMGIRFERGRWWSQAAEVSRTVLTDLKVVSPSGPALLLIDVPSRIHGAFVFTTCIGSAVHLFVPNCSRSVLLVNRDELAEIKRSQPEAEVFTWKENRLVKAVERE